MDAPKEASLALKGGGPREAWWRDINAVYRCSAIPYDAKYFYTIHSTFYIHKEVDLN